MDIKNYHNWILDVQKAKERHGREKKKVLVKFIEKNITMSEMTNSLAGINGRRKDS